MNNTKLFLKLVEIKTLLTSLNIKNKEYLNVNEASIYLSISKSTLYKLTQSNSIKFYKPNGKIILFKEEDLIKFVEKGKKKTFDDLKDEADNLLNNLNL